MNMCNETCVETQHSKVQTRVTLLFIFYSVHRFDQIGHTGKLGENQDHMTKTYAEHNRQTFMRVPLSDTGSLCAQSELSSSKPTWFSSRKYLILARFILGLKV